MTPYYQDSHVTIYHGDCLESLSHIEAETVDLIATDPPYGYSFMGKDWDRAVPDIEVWRECLRVLKPGAFAFVMCAPRQDCLGKMISNLSDAGFETGFSSIYWTYASGFPKAQNISLTIDKQECRRQLEAKLRRKATKDEMEKAWKGFRDFVGRRLFERSPYKADGTISASRQKGYLNTGHFRMGDETYDITAPATPAAQALEGSYAGFQPKPAVEVIIVCMKPLSEKTYVEQALKNQKGVTWLDEGRIPYEVATDPNRRGWQGGDATHSTSIFGNAGKGRVSFPQSGRFPANLLISNRVLDYNSSVCTNGGTTPIVGQGLPRDMAGIKAKVKPMEMPLVMGDQEVMRPNNESRLPSKERLKLQNIGKHYLKQESDSMIHEGGDQSGAATEIGHMGGGEGQSLSETTTSASCVGQQERTIEAKGYTSTTSKALQSTRNSSMKSPMAKPSVLTATVEQETTDSRSNFSRYFDLDRWWAERVKGLTESVQRTFPFLIVPKASKAEKNRGCEEMPIAVKQSMGDYGDQSQFTCPDGAHRVGNKGESKAPNYHPTVKPLKLMSYLITLGSREGDVILDPFVGSGTTCLAAQLLGRKSIGIENDEAFCEIAANRCRQMVMEFPGA